MFWNEEIETMPRPQLQTLQLARAQQTLADVYERVPFFRQSFDGTAVKPSDLQHLDDLQKFPFTRKGDLRDHYPFGLFARPLAEVVRIHGSSGTRGKLTVVGYTRKDIETWAEVMARSLAAAGAEPGDVVHNAYGYGLFTGGLGIHYGAERMGCMVVPMSGGNTPRQAMLIQDFGARILACTPSYALNIADYLQSEGIAPGTLNLAYGVFGAEPWTEEMRAEIERRLGIVALDLYGLSEIIGPGVSCECYQGKNGLHVWEDHFLVEIINPATGERVAEGEEGELTFTSLTKEAFPLVRYRTGDVASFTTAPCICGRTHGRMSRVKGRTDDMLVIRGVNIFPSEIERVLLSHAELSPYYQIVVDRSATMPHLEVHSEVSAEFFRNAGSSLNDEASVQVQELHERVEQSLQTVLSLHAAVHLEAPGAVPRSEGKAVRVVEKK